MGSELLIPEDEREEEEGEHAQEQFPFTSIFEKAFPYYLSIGMSWEEFWQGDLDLPRQYVKSHEIQRKRTNAEQWRLGQYLRIAVASCLSSEVSYPTEPFPMNEEEAREQEEKRNRARYEAMLQKMKAEARGNEDA